MKLVDVNVLVTAHREDAEHHRPVKEWLMSELAGPVGLAASELVMSGFLRVVTHPRVFKVATPLGVACEFLSDLRNCPAFHTIVPGEQHWQIFENLCRSVEAKGNTVPDAYHAALAMEFGCEWVSLDRAFLKFPGLRYHHPLTI